MHCEAQLRVMSYGKWSDRFGGEPQPYEYVDLYDKEAGQLFTWSVSEELIGERPNPGEEVTVIFTLEKRAKSALTTVKKGERKGETMDYVREDMKVKVLGFAKAQAQSHVAKTPNAKAA